MPEPVRVVAPPPGYIAANAPAPTPELIARLAELLPDPDRTRAGGERAA